jgi:hypothetical protein
MNEVTRPKFYLDKSGKYGDIDVSTDTIRDYGGKRRNYCEVFFKGVKLLSYNPSQAHIVLYRSLAHGEVFEAESIALLNECLIQVEWFRGLLVLKQDKEWVVIINGRKVPFINGMELQTSNGETFMSVPYQDDGFSRKRSRDA